jgi:membrane protein
MTSNPNILSVVKKVSSDWNSHNDARWGASLAFYTILSLSPLLALSVAVAGLIFGSSTAMRQISGQMEGMVGSAGGSGHQRCSRKHAKEFRAWGKCPQHPPFLRSICRC